jgi:dGTPase
VQTFEWRGGHIINKLFEAMINDKHLLPQDEKSHWSVSSDSHNARIVCDYLSSMTDNYALKIYSRLFESAGGKLFDI